jgi:uncharacterized protein YjgD (DUF1641 family)
VRELAKPTTKIVYKEQKQPTSGEEEQELGLSSESLSEFLSIAQKFHDKGIFQITSALLDKSDDVSRALINWMAEPDNVRFIKNVALLYGVLKDADSEKLRTFALSFNEALEVASAEMEKEKKIGIVGLAKTLNDPDVNRGIRAMIGLLRGFGKATRK